MITLSYFTENDFDTLIQWIDSKSLLTQWSGDTFSFPLTPDKLTWYLDGSNNFETSSTFVYKATDEFGNVVGHISLSGLNRENRSARITRVLVGDLNSRGKGIGEQMIRAIQEIGFKKFNLHRLSLGVYDFNQGAINCYKKCGFKTDGILRDIKKYEENYWSLMEMSILEHEIAFINTPHVLSNEVSFV